MSQVSEAQTRSPVFLITLAIVELITYFSPMDRGSFEMGPSLMPPHV